MTSKYNDLTSNPCFIANSEELFALWDELSDFGKDEMDDSLNHCMKRLCNLIGARNAFWAGTVRMANKLDVQSDPMLGWRIRGLQYMEKVYDYEAAVVRTPTKSLIAPDPAATNIAIAKSAGNHRSYRLSEGSLVDVAKFKKTQHYQNFYINENVRDRLWVIFPINAYTESIFCFDRHTEQSDFDDANLQLASYALRSIKWFHRQLLLSYGIGISIELLTDTERNVNKLLIAGSSEREIALQLNLSQGTVHQYATRIYRKFGVKGRAEFMSLWLSGGC